MVVKFFLFVFPIIVLAACDAGKAVELKTRPVDGNKILTSVLANLNHDHPGRGLADYPSDMPADVPKSYAMILLGATEDAEIKKIDHINSLGTKAGDWLIAHSDANNNGIIGWGVPVAWDAYGDGSVNPENTEYSIATAIVVDALMGWANYVDEEKRNRILDLVEKALTPYLSKDIYTPAGLLPYSLLPHDRPYDTFNSAVYLAGQLQRYSKLARRPEMKENLQLAADSTMVALIKHKKKGPERGFWYWDYSIQELSPNDLPHAGYIIEGVLTYIQNNGRLASRFNMEKVFNHLMDFVGEDEKIRGWPVFRPEITTPPRLYDLSIAAQLMCRFKGKEYAGIFLGEIDKYAGQKGGYYKYPSGTERNKQVAEYEAYLYRALMSCGFGENENAQ